MRTWNTAIANANDTSSVMSETIVMLTIFAAMNTNREMGALRRRAHRPRSRSTSISIPRLSAEKSKN